MVFDLLSSKGVSPAGTPITSSEELLAQTFFFPPELIGGSCPYIKGEEEMLAWNAAAEACDSERIHFVWKVYEGRVWYLAVRSADLASHSGSWCPFGSLLPGSDDASSPPVIYTYYSEEAAIMMAIEPDGLQVIRGTVSIIRAKAERMAREMSNAELVDLIPDTIVKLKPAPWESMSLLENRARRFFAFALVAGAMVVTSISFFIWLSASVAQLSYKGDLSALQARTSDSVMQLQQTAMVLRTSEFREQISAFNTLNEALIALPGWLKRYSIDNNQVKWWALVPDNLTSDRIQELGAQTIENTPEGLVIANSKDAVIRRVGR